MATKTPRYFLYRSFVDAYMKGHPEMTRCISYHSAQTEWNAIKKDDDVVQEKIEEYLEIYNRSGAAGLALEEAAPKRKKTTKTTTKSKKKRKHSSSSDNDDEAVTAKEIVTTT